MAKKKKVFSLDYRVKRRKHGSYSVYIGNTEHVIYREAGMWKPVGRQYNFTKTLRDSILQLIM